MAYNIITGIYSFTVEGAGFVVPIRQLSLPLMLELEVHRTRSQEGNMDVRWEDQEQTRCHKHYLEVHEARLKPMLVFVVSALGDKGIPKK